MIDFVMLHVEVADEEESWVRHFMSSVGVLITQVAKPPIAPATNGIHRLVGEVVVLDITRFESKGDLEESRSEVRL